jgi:ATP-dependent HslUV protease ATP-binding subunit HslU
VCSSDLFIKVEATKYTEVGYVGRDVESMVRDLMAYGFQMVKKEMQDKVQSDAEKQAEEDLLDLLVPSPQSKKKQKKDSGAQPVITPMGSFSFNGQNGTGSVMGTAIQVGVIPVGDGAAQKAKETQPELDETPPAPADTERAKSTREKFRAMLREGKLEDKLVEITVNQSPPMSPFEMMGGGMEDMEASFSSGIAGIFGGGKKKKLLPVSRARKILTNEDAEKMIDSERVSEEAKQRVQEMGIIFIDEIDKIAVKGDRGGPDVSREGVQRDILPIVEGASVNTKWGPVDTRHILFVAAGAFNISKPSDLIPELQGRFPLRVELDSLGKDDFLRILTEPQNALTRQYRDLLGTENIEIEFTPESIDRIAALAADVNSRLENIGARRLHTIMETLLEEISFDAPDIAPKKITITPEMVDERLADLAKDQDMGRYIL